MHVSLRIANMRKKCGKSLVQVRFADEKQDSQMVNNRYCNQKKCGKHENMRKTSGFRIKQETCGCKWLAKSRKPHVSNCWLYSLLPLHLDYSQCSGELHSATPEYTRYTHLWQRVDTHDTLTAHSQHTHNNITIYSQYTQQDLTILTTFLRNCKDLMALTTISQCITKIPQSSREAHNNTLLTTHSRKLARRSRQHNDNDTHAPKTRHSRRHTHNGTLANHDTLMTNS